MQQVIVIGGGDTFDTYDEYLAALRGRTLTLDRMRGKGWRSALGPALGDRHEVLSLRMPCVDNAKYLEWKIVFEQLLPLLSTPAIFIGHSLGGIFLAKYFSAERKSEKVKALFLIAAPYESEEGYSLGDFTITDNLANLATSDILIHLYQSKDDPIVSFSNLDQYVRALPKAIPHIFDDRGHFLGEEFPELVQDILSIE